MSLFPPFVRRYQHFYVRANATEIDGIPARSVGIIDVRSVLQKHFTDFKLTPKDGFNQRHSSVVGHHAKHRPFLSRSLTISTIPRKRPFQGLVQMGFSLVGLILGDTVPVFTVAALHASRNATMIVRADDIIVLSWCLGPIACIC